MSDTPTQTDRPSRTSPITPAEALEAIQARAAFDTAKDAADALGITRPALSRRIAKADQWGMTAHGELSNTPMTRFDLPPTGTARYILTCAQSNTKAHGPFLENLEALAQHLSAKIMVSRIRYNHTSWQVGQEKVDREVDTSLWYDARLEPYFCDTRTELFPGFIWAGDTNIPFTATNPLSGLDSFTGIDSCAFPHPQIALKSIATAPGVDTKFNYATGSVTLKHYIKRKAGLKAEFHHAYAALLVEVDASGVWFARQINATEDGAFFDLDLRVEGGQVTSGHRVGVMTPGDIHGTEIDPIAQDVVWGSGGMMDTLRPLNQFLHDVLNFGRRSHHSGVFDKIVAHYAGAEAVEGEIVDTANVLNRLLRPWTKTHVVKANHDEHFDRWLADADWRTDPINAEYYLTAAKAKVQAIKAGDDGFDLTEWALKRAGLSGEVVFLSRSDRCVKSGIRHDLHGDIGPNGSRGSAANIARTGEKTNIGHSHSAHIVHGCYQMGTMSALDMGYNRGPSSWSHSIIITYANGKRAIITLRNGKWRV